MRSIIWSMLVAVVSCGNPQQSKTTQQLESPIMPALQLHAAFLVVNGIYSSELVAPMDVFQHTIYHNVPGIQVFTVAEAMDTITTFEGLQLLPDFTFETAPGIDILVVPGARHSVDTDLEKKGLIDFVTRAGKEASYVFSLGTGAYVLAQAGLLDNHACTTRPADRVAFGSRFPHLQVQEKVIFVHDRKALTSAGGARSYDPALYLVEMMYGKVLADGVAEDLMLDWNVNQVPHLITSF